MSDEIKTAEDIVLKFERENSCRDYEKAHVHITAAIELFENALEDSKCDDFYVKHGQHHDDHHHDDHHHGHSHSHGSTKDEHGHSHVAAAPPSAHGHSHGNENELALFLHVLADTLGSVGVIISSLIVHYFGWNSADAVCSFLISILIFVR